MTNRASLSGAASASRLLVRSALLLALLLLLCCSAFVSAANPNRVLLKDVSAITLQRNAMTTGRRSAPVPQMTCTGGPCQWAPSSVLCSNAGFDGADVLWKSARNNTHTWKE
jgi:hypothetical protein